MDRSARFWVSGLALIVGIGAVVASFVAASTRIGAGLIFGFGAFIAFFALLSLLVRNRAADFFGLLVAGLAMFILPFLGQGFVEDDGAAWTGWIAGFLTMVLGGVGWLRAKPGGPSAPPGREAEINALTGWIGRVAVVIGAATVVLGVTVPSSPIGAGVTIGLGALITVIGVWSVLADDPTRDYLTLGVVGFALFLGPWAAAFNDDDVAWVAWIAGGIVTALAVAGYLRSETSAPVRRVGDTTNR